MINLMVNLIEILYPGFVQLPFLHTSALGHFRKLVEFFRIQNPFFGIKLFPPWHVKSRSSSFTHLLPLLFYS